MLRSKKYNRPLSEYEGKRYQELVELFRKVNGERYNGEIINSKSNETLADIACSKQRYASVSKYYSEKLKEKQSRIQREDGKDRERMMSTVKKALESLGGIEVVEMDCSQLGCECRREEIQEENSDHVDMKAAQKEFENCYNLMQSRNAKYGNSWKQLRNSSIIDLMIMKLDRCQKQALDNKALEVEAEDVVNYGIFLLMNLRKK